MGIRRRRFVGNAPDEGVEVAASGDLTLYHMPKQDNGSWANLKLVAKQKRRRKANWWFGWNKDEQRLAESRDVKTLKDKNPEVVDWLVVQCQQTFGCQHG